MKSRTQVICTSIRSLQMEEPNGRLPSTPMAAAKKESLITSVTTDGTIPKNTSTWVLMVACHTSSQMPMVTPKDKNMMPMVMKFSENGKTRMAQSPETTSTMTEI